MELKDKIHKTFHGQQYIKVMLIIIQETVFFYICQDEIINSNQWKHNATLSQFVDAEPIDQDARNIEE